MTMAARLLSNPLFWITDAPTEENLREVWFVNVGSLDPYWDQFFISRDWAQFPHFPYGLELA